MDRRKVYSSVKGTGSDNFASVIEPSASEQVVEPGVPHTLGVRAGYWARADGSGFSPWPAPLVAGDFPFLEEGQLFMHEGLGMASELFWCRAGGRS